MGNTIDPKKLDELIQLVSQKSGANSADIKNAVEEKGVENLIGQLNPAQQKQVQKILNDRSAAEQLLASPQARQLLQKLMGK